MNARTTLRSYLTRPHSAIPTEEGTESQRYPANVDWGATYLRDVFHRYGKTDLASHEKGLDMTADSILGEKEADFRKNLSTARQQPEATINSADFLRFCCDFNICPQLLSVADVNRCARASCLGGAKGGTRCVLSYTEFVEAVVCVATKTSWKKILRLFSSRKIPVEWKWVEERGVVLGKNQRIKVLESQYPAPYNNDFLIKLCEDDGVVLDEAQQEKKSRTRLMLSVIAQENARRIEAPREALEYLKIFIKLFIYAGSTLLAVPISRTLFGAIDCSDVGGTRMWDKDISVSCLSSDHIVVLCTAIAEIVLFMPFLVRYASLGGDPSELRTPDHFTHIEKIKYVIYDSWWEESKYDKGEMQLEVGPLTRGTTSGTFDVATVSSRDHYDRLIKMRDTSTLQGEDTGAIALTLVLSSSIYPNPNRCWERSCWSLLRYSRQTIRYPWPFASTLSCTLKSSLQFTPSPSEVRQPPSVAHPNPFPQNIFI